MNDGICDPHSFYNEARWQTTCAACDRPRPFQAHHVVDQQTLRRRCGLRGKALWNTRNALRLCQQMGNADIRCHFQHENRVEGCIVKTTKLTDDNIDYAFEMLGPYALDYLRNEYDDSDPDPRLRDREEAMAA